MPAYVESIFDRISLVKSELKRRILDHNIRLIGTKVLLMRITNTNTNSYGDPIESITSSLVNNVTLKYPLSESELFGSSRSGSLFSDATNLWNILPITMTQYYNGDLTETTAEIKPDDFIIDVLRDNKGNLMPIPMQVIRIMGKFEGKNLIHKKYELSLIRGTLPESVQATIDEYIGIPYVKSIVPDVETIDVAIDGSIVINFSVPMDTAVTEGSISITPSFTSSKVWSLGDRTVTITPDSDLTPATRYDIAIDRTVTSLVGLTMKQIVNSYFVTA